MLWLLSFLLVVVVEAVLAFLFYKWETEVGGVKLADHRQNGKLVAGLSLCSSNFRPQTRNQVPGC